MQPATQEPPRRPARSRATVGEDAVDNPRVSYEPLEGATPEDELAALAAAFTFVLECFERRRACVRTEDYERSVGADVGEQPSAGEDS